MQLIVVHLFIAAALCSGCACAGSVIHSDEELLSQQFYAMVSARSPQFGAVVQAIRQSPDRAFVSAKVGALGREFNSWAVLEFVVLSSGFSDAPASSERPVVTSHAFLVVFAGADEMGYFANVMPTYIDPDTVKIGAPLYLTDGHVEEVWRIRDMVTTDVLPISGRRASLASTISSFENVIGAFAANRFLGLSNSWDGSTAILVTTHRDGQTHTSGGVNINLAVSESRDDKPLNEFRRRVLEVMALVKRVRLGLQPYEWLELER